MSIYCSGQISLIRETADLIPKVAEMGFDGVEIPIFDPDTVDIPLHPSTPQGYRFRDLSGVISWRGDRNPIDEDPAIRENAKTYLKRCCEIVAELGADTLVGPMYSAVGKLVGRARNEQGMGLVR